MSDTTSYSAREHLRDGSPVEVRAFRPEDEAGMLSALDQASPQSLQRRFFAMKRHFSDKERAFFMKVDFRDHGALVVAGHAGWPRHHRRRRSIRRLRAGAGREGLRRH